MTKDYLPHLSVLGFVEDIVNNLKAVHILDSLDSRRVKSSLADLLTGDNKSVSQIRHKANYRESIMCQINVQTQKEH